MPEEGAVGGSEPGAGAVAADDGQVSVDAVQPENRSLLPANLHSPSLSYHTASPTEWLQRDERGGHWIKLTLLEEGVALALAWVVGVSHVLDAIIEGLGNYGNCSDEVKKVLGHVDFGLRVFSAVLFIIAAVLLTIKVIRNRRGR